jgi:hypothetical protein
VADNSAAIAAPNDGDLSGGERNGGDRSGGDRERARPAASSSWSEGSSVDFGIVGGGFHLGFSDEGRGGGDVEPLAPGAPNAPRPCKAAIRSLRLPPMPILSLASVADMPLVRRAAISSDVVVVALGLGELGGLGDFGFQLAPPGLGRGTGAGGGGDAGPLFSKAAIRSLREPGLGLVGGGSDMMTVKEKRDRAGQACGSRSKHMFPSEAPISDRGSSY